MLAAWGVPTLPTRVKASSTESSLTVFTLSASCRRAFRPGSVGVGPEGPELSVEGGAAWGVLDWGWVTRHAHRKLCKNGVLGYRTSL